MEARRGQVLLLAFLGVLLHGAWALEGPGLCAAEPACMTEACTDAYLASAAAFPYSIDFTRTGDALSTTFVWKVCSAPCSASDPYCQPLAALQLRLANAILDSPGAALKLVPEGAEVELCGPRGPGLLLSNASLPRLASAAPSQDHACELFRLTFAHETARSVPLGLSDVCQQDVTLIDANGTSLFNQTDFGTSCLFVAELADGKSGFSLVHDDGDSAGETTFQVDSLADTTLPCGDFWQPAGPGAGQPNEVAYRLGLASVLEGIAGVLGDSRPGMVRGVSTQCEAPLAGGPKRMRSTVRVSIGEGLEVVYLARLRDGVDGAAFREAAAALGAAAGWLPLPMHYASGAAAVCPASEAECAQGEWDPAVAVRVPI